MILAEKIMNLRKKNRWSQEDLAMKLNVSRQSVSKWENASSIPDLDKIIKLSEIFQVSTDYLLKNNIEIEDAAPNSSDDESEDVRSISLEDANQYMDQIFKSAKKIAGGVSICILSPVILMLLLALADTNSMQIPESIAIGIGVTILILLVAGAVSLFIINGMHLSKYSYLETEPISLQHGVTGIVETKRDEFKSFYTKCIVSGVILCIISIVPYIIAAALDAEDMTYLFCTALVLILVSNGVVINGSYQRLLEENDYSRDKKMEAKKNESISVAYWCIVTAVYLGISLGPGLIYKESAIQAWRITWMIWPCAGILFAAIRAIAGIIRKK